MENLSISVYLFIIVYLYKNIEAATFGCDFERGDFCSWKHDNLTYLRWTRGSYTSGNGYYIFIRSSRNNKGKCRLISPMKLPGQYCLTFWYGMNGRDIGDLNVYLTINGNETVIFTKEKSIGSHLWKSALNLKADKSYQIVLEGVIGNDGIIAIDDISLKSGLCSIDCDFDDDFCNWIQYDEDDFDWKRQTGSTLTSNNRPSADHTSGHGNYIYIESIEQYRQDTAIILSPYLDAGKYCVSYWYYMYGSNIDRLHLQLWHTDGTKETLRSIKSQKSQQWFYDMITVSSKEIFKIAFKGIVKDYFYEYNWLRSDIAIDDVALSPCHDCSDPTPNHGSADSTNYAYGSVVNIQCNHGYTLKGDSVIVCKSMEQWNGSAECMLYDCGNLTIQNGTFITPNGTTFGQVGRQECDTGFVLIGEPSIRCTVNGWANTFAYCEIVECGNLTTPNGIFITPNGTTFGQVGILKCDTGFVLIGEQSIRCAVNGWSNTSAYCKIIDTEYLETINIPLAAVYVLPPVIVIIIAVLITVVYIRRRHPHCMKIFKTVHEATNASTEVSQNGQSHSNQTYSNEAVQLDDEYATIAEEQNKADCLDTVYYAKVKRKITKDSDKIHAIVVNRSSGKNDRYGLNRYDLSNIEQLNSRIDKDEHQDADYDHACTGKVNTKALNINAYSHIVNLETEYQHTLQFDKQTDMQNDTYYSHIDRKNTILRFPKHFERDNKHFDNDFQNKTARSRKVLEENIPKIKHTGDQSVEYYNVETNVESTKSKSCFMVEENKQKIDNDGWENHDYFILEKT